MAYRRSLSTRASLIARQRLSSFSYALHDDERKHHSLDEGLPQPKIGNFIQRRSFGSGFNNSAGFGAFFQDRRCSHFTLASGIGSSFCRHMSTTVGEGSDVAGVIAETVQEVASQAPAVNEVAVAAADSFFNVAALQHIIDMVHSFTGLNWWASIAVTTLLIRGVTVPLLIQQVKASTKLMAIKPQMEELSQDVKAKGFTGSIESQKKLKELYKEHGVSPWTPMMGLLIQGPIFASFFFAITNMAEKVPSFKTGGAFWFTDLSTPDSLYIFPVLTALTFLTMVECNMQEGMEGNPAARKMKDVSRVFAFLTVPFTMGFPKAIFCYWMTSNMFSLIYGFAVRRPAVRKFLGLPEVPVTPNPATPKPAFSLFPALKQAAAAIQQPKPAPAEPSKAPNQSASSSSVTSQKLKKLEKEIKGKRRRNKRR